MKINSINKKLVSNLILGSSLYGISAGIITQVQATPTPPQGRQDVHKYNPKATEQLRALLARPETPLKECINLVQFQNADPNIQVGLFTLLEEVVLTRSGLSVKPLIDKGADIYRVTNRQVIKNEQGKIMSQYGRTLLHLAVYPPQRARKLLDEHRQKKGGTVYTPKELYKLGIDNYISRISVQEDLLSPREKDVKELLDCGFGLKEIIMGETPNGTSPSVTALYWKKELLKLKSKSKAHEKMHEEYEKIDELFNERLKWK
jgi:hypothetical protein